MNGMSESPTSMIKIVYFDEELAFTGPQHQLIVREVVSVDEKTGNKLSSTIPSALKEASVSSAQ